MDVQTATIIRTGITQTVAEAFGPPARVFVLMVQDTDGAWDILTNMHPEQYNRLPDVLRGSADLIESKPAQRFKPA